MDTNATNKYSRSQPCQIAVVLFDGFELIDVFGPLEMFGNLGDRARISLLGREKGAVHFSEQKPMSAQATDSYENDETYDLLIVPGGFGTRSLARDPVFLKKLVGLAARCQWIASVCTGSALLAAAGLLEGRRATGNKSVWSWIVTQGRDVRWVPQARWVEDGNVFTSGGACAGMDMSLAIIARFFGEPVARKLSQYTEYAWTSDPSHDPFAESFGLI